VRYKTAIPKQTLHEKEVINLKDGGRRKEGVSHFWQKTRSTALGDAPFSVHIRKLIYHNG
jgi:hypothetical protein